MSLMQIEFNVYVRIFSLLKRLTLIVLQIIGY